MAPRHGEPVFVISVAARLLEMHPQTLRKYEREGLIAPSRTSGNLRLYSDSDIERLRQVKYLVEERGLNLAGVQLALELTRRLRDLRGRSGFDEEQFCRDMDGILALLGIGDDLPSRQRRMSRDPLD